MHRILVALLSAFDALIAAAAGIAAAAAPLTLLWVLGLDGADWRALWPTSAAVWQLGNLAPLHIALPDEYLADVGIPADAASFVVSLAPLAFAAFTAIFAARSGTRAAGASAWITGVLVGTRVFAVLALIVALAARNPVGMPRLWQAVVLPAALYGGAALIGAIIAAWRRGDDGIVDRLRARVELLPHGWGSVPGLAVRTAAMSLTALIGLGALLVAVSLIARGDEVIALYERAQVDAIGALVLTLGQLAYLPTIVVWGVAWIAGPGFAVGTGTAVSPAGTQLGVVPGIPLLGIVPESMSSWLLLVLLLPIAAGAFAGWVARSRFVAAAGRTAEPVGPRLVVALLAAILTAGGAALLALVASGALGPGRLEQVGPDPGPVALAVGLEVFVGAAILLLSPRASARAELGEDVRAPEEPAVLPAFGPVPAGVPDAEHPTTPIEPVESAGRTDPRAEPPDPSTLGPARPAPLPPVD